MTVQSYDLTHSHAGLLARASGWVQDRLTELQAGIENARRLEQLERLSDRTLHDIGLNRSELTSVVSHPHDATRVR